VELGHHLRELRLAQGLDAEQLAQRCRLSADVIRELELGQHRADLDTLMELAVALGIRLSVIFKLWEAQALEDRGPKN
jgi:transcriptional regulator with XRE-family HTH domain